MKHDPFQEVELTAEESAAIDAMLKNGTGRPKYLLPRTSTPITADGLLGLGMEQDKDDDGVDVWWVPYPNYDGIAKRMLSVSQELDETNEPIPDVWYVEIDYQVQYPAPDLEAVSDLIEVLRRMNGSDQ